MKERNLALTFAGGGNRAFYQTGFMNRLGPTLYPRVGVVASCSAGACAACLYFSGRSEATHAFWVARRAHVTRNIDPLRLLRGERMAPHGEVYRDTMVFSMKDGGLERLRALPFPLLVVAAAFPAAFPALLAVGLGLSAYNLEKRVAKDRVHPTFGRKLGFEPFVFDARACESPEEVADLVLASSSTPPFTPIGGFRGTALLDGGMVDNVPVFAAEGRPGIDRHLVLLTRPYPRGVTGRRGERLYVGPTEPTPVGRWDYTRPELVRRTIEMGERESELYAHDVARLLEA